MPLDRIFTGTDTGILLPYIALTVLLPFSLIYVMGFLRGKNGDKDPLLGAKTVSLLVLTIAFQILLIGLSGMLESLLNTILGVERGYSFRGPDDGWRLKTSAAYCVSALLVGAYGYYTYRFRASLTGDGQVLRQASGLNAISTGIVAIITLTLVLVALFNNTELGDLTRQISLLLVYAIGHLAAMKPVLHNWQAAAPATVAVDESASE